MRPGYNEEAGQVLSIMLCGAADTAEIREYFAEIVADVGGQPLHYLSGEVWYTNSRTSSWTLNSTQTVLQADICVFVIVEDYGAITWTDELQAALEAGKPFLVLCRDRTYEEYLTLGKEVATLDAILDPDKRRLVQVMRELEYNRQLTIVQFSPATFRETLRRQLASLFSISIRLLQVRIQREALALTVADPAKLSHADLQRLVELALDELEDKNPRKRAIRALALTGGIADDDLLQLLESNEQGVQRLAIQELSALHRTSPPDTDFIDRVVDVSNRADDVGVPRRLIQSLIQMDLPTAVAACANLALDEEGSRRRLAFELEQREEDVKRLGLTTEVRALVERCLLGPTGRDWKQAAREFQERLRDK